VVPPARAASRRKRGRERERGVPAARQHGARSLQVRGVHSASSWRAPTLAASGWRPAASRPTTDCSPRTRSGTASCSWARVTSASPRRSPTSFRPGRRHSRLSTLSSLSLSRSLGFSHILNPLPASPSPRPHLHPNPPSPDRRERSRHRGRAAAEVPGRDRRAAGPPARQGRRLQARRGRDQGRAAPPRRRRKARGGRGPACPARASLV
jgi:hypothetical protein